MASKKDPARRIGSSHVVSPARTYVMDVLGLSKPGFNDYWRRRTYNPYGDYESGDEETFQDYQPEITPLQYSTVDYGAQQRTKKEPKKMLEFETPATAAANKRAPYLKKNYN